jgi:hypothetical protein
MKKLISILAVATLYSCSPEDNKPTQCFCNNAKYKTFGDISGNYFYKKVEIDCNTRKPKYDPNLIFIGCDDKK